MERKRSISSVDHNNTPVEKKPCVRHIQNSEDGRRECSSSSHSSISHTFTSNTHPRSRESTESTQTLPDRPVPYTAAFFSDLSRTVAQVFPFEEFAKEHNCSIAEVSQAISATIICPLSDPEFRWFKDCGLSTVEYGNQMVALWKEHYQSKLETSGVARGHSANSMSSCSALYTPPDAQEEQSTYPNSSTSSSSRGHPGIEPPTDFTVYSPNKRHVKGTSSPSAPHSSACETTSPTSYIEPLRVQVTGRSRSPRDPEQRIKIKIPPGRRSKAAVSTAKQPTSSTTRTGRLIYQRSERRGTRTPVVRQHVYKDYFGNYIPIVPKEKVSIPEQLATYARRRN